MIRWLKLGTAVASACLSAVISGTPATTAEIVTLCHANVRPAVEAIIPAFERASGHKVTISYLPVPAIGQQIDSGSRVDLAIAFSDRMDDFVRTGKFPAGSRFEVMRSGIGVAVRAGAPKPDISSASALKNTLLAAKSVAFSQGPTGVHLTTVIQRLGIADQLKSKLTMTAPGLGSVATMVANGEIEIGIHGIYELVPIAGIDIVGPIPAELQKMIVYSAMIPSNAKEPEAANALVNFFSSDSAIPLLKTTGMEP
jgi:molybdate transport system substrate-binding protein